MGRLDGRLLEKELSGSAVLSDLHLPAGTTVGRHSYGFDEGTFRLFVDSARIELGAFCSIGAQVRVLAGSEHVMSRASTFPLNTFLFEPGGGNALDAVDRGVTVIGNDVWIGLGAIVLSGVLVGDGAVIGAGAVVSRHVPSYAVVAGNPAQIIRYRFPKELRERLLRLRWWEWSDEEIVALKSSFMSNAATFIEVAERAHGRRPQSELSRRLGEMPPNLLTPHRGFVANPDHRVSELKRHIDATKGSMAWRWASGYLRKRARPQKKMRGR